MVIGEIAMPYGGRVVNLDRKIYARADISPPVIDKETVYYCQIIDIDHLKLPASSG